MTFLLTRGSKRWPIHPIRVSFFVISSMLLIDLYIDMHESRAICELQDRRYLLMLNNAEIARKVKPRVRATEFLDVNPGSNCKFVKNFCFSVV